MSQYLDYLKILGVKETASFSEIKKSYYELVQIWHPDKHTNEKIKSRANEELKKINNAFEYVKKNYKEPLKSSASSNAKSYQNAYNTSSQNHQNEYYKHKSYYENSNANQSQSNQNSSGNQAHSYSNTSLEDILNKLLNYLKKQPYLLATIIFAGLLFMMLSVFDSNNQVRPKFNELQQPSYEPKKESSSKHRKELLEMMEKQQQTTAASPLNNKPDTAVQSPKKIEYGTTEKYKKEQTAPIPQNKDLKESADWFFE